MKYLEFQCGDKVRVTDDFFKKIPHVGDVGVITSAVSHCRDWDSQTVSFSVRFETDPYEIYIAPCCLEFVKSKEEMACEEYMKQGVIKTDKMQVGEEYNQPKDDENLIRNIITEIDKLALYSLCSGNTDAIKYLYEMRRYYEQCGSDKH